MSGEIGNREDERGSFLTHRVEQTGKQHVVVSIVTHAQFFRLFENYD